MMAQNNDSAQIHFTTRQQVIDFLKSRNIEDGEIKWTCPVCGTVNHGAYYSHEARCGGCDKFTFPRLSLKEFLKKDEEATEIAKELERYRERISLQREVIEDLEADLAKEKEELENLKDEFSALRSCNTKKVRVW